MPKRNGKLTVWEQNEKNLLVSARAGLSINGMVGFLGITRPTVLAKLRRYGLHPKKGKR